MATPQLPQPASSTDQERLKLLVAYTAGLNPNGVRQLAFRHGYDPRQLADLNGFLLRFLVDGGEPALDELLTVHPDRDMLLDSHPAPAATPLRSLPPPATSLASQLAQLANQHKNAVVDVLNRHGAAVLYDEPTRGVAREAARALQTDNPVLVQELGALAATPADFTNAYQVAQAAGTLPALLGDIDVSMGADSAAVAKTKTTLVLSVVAGLLLLACLYLLLLNRKPS